MRKSRQEAAETRKRIVRAAAREFRERGIVATGLADLMKAAGLTHGGFYKHFASKDQLVAEATVVAMDSVLEKLAAQPTVNSAVAGYLSTRHRDKPASGCPLAALGGELARSDMKARAAPRASILASVPLLVKRTRSSDGKRSQSNRANWPSRSPTDARLSPRSMAACRAAWMRGSECPNNPAVYSPQKST